MVNPSKKPKPNPPPSPHHHRPASNPSAASKSPSGNLKPRISSLQPGEVITISDSDEEARMMDDLNENDDSQAEFEYDSDVIISDGEDGIELGVEPMSVSEPDDDQPPSPPPELITSKGKGSSRKTYTAHIAQLVELYAAQSGNFVKDFRRDGDEGVQFKLMTPARKNGLGLVIMTPEVGGYPDKAQHLCYAQEDIDSATEAVIAEVATLPPRADRSLQGVIDHLILRLVKREPSHWSRSFNEDEPSDGEYDSDDDMFGLGIADVAAQIAAFNAALRKDMKQILGAGYRCGFHRVSELDHVMVCSVRVHELGVPLRALQAWDSNLITGEVVCLVLLLNFGAKYPVDMDDMSFGQVRFKVGLSPKYKPNSLAIGAAFRSHSSAYTAGEFESFALSAPLDSLFGEKFQEILACRRKYSVGWAAAEEHSCALGGAKATINKKAAAKTDKDEKAAAASYKMAADPQASAATRDNFPLTAFSYLIRRFVMCPKFCLICYKEAEFSSLKPFVCQNDLCLFQLMNLGLAVSLENELLTNPASVDLLVSLCYTAAAEYGLKDATHFPYGLGLQVPERAPWIPGCPTKEFDSMTDNTEKCLAIVGFINELPRISAMRSWILKEDVPETDKVLYHARKLSDMPGIGGRAVSPSAWKLLRWTVASCTSYLKEITEGDELVQGLSKSYRQFKLLVGSPQKEHLLAEHVKTAQAKNANAIKYPTLHAFHGSSVKNFHNILREGLHFRETINGRAYGHGIYFAKQGDISLSSYSAPSASSWKQSEFTVGKVAAICEIVNLPGDFVSNNPYFVVQHVEWVQARYLIVSKIAGYGDVGGDEEGTGGPHSKGHYIDMDPAHPITLANQPVIIPDIVPKLEELNKRLAWEEDPLNDSDDELLKDPPLKLALAPSAIKPLKSKRSLGISSSHASVDDSIKAKTVKEKDAFRPVGPEILKMVRMLPPPKAPNRGALLSVTKEMKAMVIEQDREGSVNCGFHFDPDRSNDNVFAWLIEIPIASFEQSIPLVKDCNDKKVTSILMEIRFGETFPLAPPFFRVVYPRFLPFVHGGGGHVTGGGSICMDLLTPDAWNPVYTVSAVLLQIRMAMSNLEPRSARLDSQGWNQPYSMAEAIEGFKRAASTHGWSIPADLDKMKY